MMGVVPRKQLKTKKAAPIEETLEVEQSYE